MRTASRASDPGPEKAQASLVAFLKQRKGESTAADMVSGTGLSRAQVDQAARLVLDEYDGRVKVTESGELLYYFPSGLRSTARGAGPAFRRFLKAFAAAAAKVLSLLFKIWIVAMLVGYFVAFLALLLAAVVASFAASVASRGERGDSRRSGGGFGGGFLVMRLLDLALRMWFITSLTRDPRRPAGRPFYKNVFGFVFGEGDPNRGWEERERRTVLAWLRGHKGIISIEEFMALTGRDHDDAQKAINSYMAAYEGEPRVTEEGTLYFAFPELLRTSAAEQKAAETSRGQAAFQKSLVPFSANKRRTNGWIGFFNAFNLAFGSYFLVIGLAQGAAALGRSGPLLYSFVGRLLGAAGIPPVPFMTAVLGVVPVVFSILFFLVPILRKARLDRVNSRVREDALRQRILARILARPASVGAPDIEPTDSQMDPRGFAAARKRILDGLAALRQADPVLQEKDGSFSYRFASLERETADLERTRRDVDLRKLEVGKTVFDSGE